MVVSPDKIFFLRINGGEWKHVSKQEWVSAERHCEFINKVGPQSEPATASFGRIKGNEVIDGRIVNITYFKPEDYDWDPDYRDAVSPVVEAAKTWFDPKWAEEVKADFLEQAHKTIFEGETPDDG